MTDVLSARATRRATPWALAAVVAVLVGLSGNDFLISVATTTVLWIMLGGGLNLMMGYGGLANLGVGASYGIGAYAAGLVATRTGLPLVVALVVGVVVAAAAAAIVAPLVLRTRGLHFAIATLALGIVATDLFTNLVGLTGGSVGLSGIARPALVSTGVAMYALVAALGAVMMVLFALYHRSRIAIVLRGMRDDDQLTRSLGYRVTAYKIAAYIAGAATAGLAGGLYAYFIQYLEPSEFALAGASFQAFAIVAFGGAGSLWGPVVGAVLLTGLPTFVDLDPIAKMAAYGLALLVVVLLVPEGVVPGARRLTARLGHAWTRRRDPPPDDRGTPAPQVADPNDSPAAASRPRTPTTVEGPR